MAVPDRMETPPTQGERWRRGLGLWGVAAGVANNTPCVVESSFCVWWKAASVWDVV